MPVRFPLSWTYATPLEKNAKDPDYEARTASVPRFQSDIHTEPGLTRAVSEMSAFSNHGSFNFIRTPYQLAKMPGQSVP